MEAFLKNYQFWRDEKLANTPTELADYLVEINNPFSLSKAEKNQICDLCQRACFAIFQLPEQSDYLPAVVSINAQLGLRDFDQHLYAKDHGIATITQTDNPQQAEFIPYTNQAIGWHTDGYYNALPQRIRAFSLFCVRPAVSGGENQWIDPQMVYLLLRENNPDIAHALTHPKAMCIPEHKVGGKVRRAAATGAIFFIDEVTARLSMRYTQRKKNIEFLDSVEIKQAVAALNDLLRRKTAYHFVYLMQSGEGLLCNNLLHKRSAFTDAKTRPRLLLRGRYFNQIDLA